MNAAADAARRAETRPALQLLARGGFAANGIVHIGVGIIVVVVAAGGDGESDQTGALKAIAAAPLGFVVLWILAIMLGALALWHLADGFLVRAPDDAASAQVVKWSRRVGEWGQAIVFVLLGMLTASVALGARPDAEDAAEGASRGVLSLPGGSLVLVIVALVVGGCGVAFVVMGLRAGFRARMQIPTGAPGRVVTALGMVGFVAKGVALVIVAVLLVVAAVTLDPAAAGGLDGAIDALLLLAYGPWVVGAVGVGLITYGVFCVLRARYAELSPGRAPRTAAPPRWMRTMRPNRP